MNRTTSMSRKWFKNKVPNNVKIIENSELASLSKMTVDKYIYNFNAYKLDLASSDILNLAIKTNLYLNEKEPWKLIKQDSNIPLVKEIIYNVLESTRIIGLLLLPILPDLSKKIDEQLGFIYENDSPWQDQLKWGLLNQNSELPNPFPIINKLEYE